MRVRKRRAVRAVVGQDDACLTASSLRSITDRAARAQFPADGTCPFDPAIWRPRIRHVRAFSDSGGRLVSSGANDLGGCSARERYSLRSSVFGRGRARSCDSAAGGGTCGFGTRDSCPVA